MIYGSFLDQNSIQCVLCAFYYWLVLGYIYNCGGVAYKHKRTHINKITQKTTKLTSCTPTLFCTIDCTEHRSKMQLEKCFDFVSFFGGLEKQTKWLVDSDTVLLWKLNASLFQERNQIWATQTFCLKDKRKKTRIFDKEKTEAIFFSWHFTNEKCLWIRKGIIDYLPFWKKVHKTKYRS